jgi:hypothetical protein
VLEGAKEPWGNTLPTFWVESTGFHRTLRRKIVASRTLKREGTGVTAFGHVCVVVLFAVEKINSIRSWGSFGGYGDRFVVWRGPCAASSSP